MSGRLACHNRCNLFDKRATEPSGRERETIEYDQLRRLHVSFGEACNIRCVMCDHPQRHAKNPILLDPQVVIRNVDLSPFTTVMIQGGEPLFLSQSLDFMGYLERIGKRYTLLSNGLLINDQVALRLARHAKSVNVSLNGATKSGHESVNRGSRFERVIENIQRLRKAREALGTDMTIVGHMTITTSNVHEVPMFLQSFRSFGFDRVNFGYVKETVPLYLSANPTLTAQLRDATSSAIGNTGQPGVDTLRLEMLGLWNPREISAPAEAAPSSNSALLPMLT